MSLSRPLLSRLQHDLVELHDSPYPGVSVFTDDANLRKLCLVLTPPSGPWKELSLHFDVDLPDNWPSSPPIIRSSVSGIEHPNLFGDYICCDLLRETSSLQRGYTGGYTPALTLRGLFLQFLTFFSNSKVEQDYGAAVQIGDDITIHYIRENDLARNMAQMACAYQKYISSCSTSDQEQSDLGKLWNSNPSPETVVVTYASNGGNVIQKTKQPLGGKPDSNRLFKFEQKNPKWASTYSLISKWQCRTCPYGSETVPHSAIQPDAMDVDVDTSSLLLVPPPTCFLGLLNDDVIFTLASFLPSESVLSFSAAYPRMHTIVTSMHVLLQRELRCFFLRTPLQQSVLGIGITFDAGPRKLSSDFDWLSEEAFVRYNVRKSIQKRDLQFFLPLAFSRPHFTRVEVRIWARLTEIDDAVRVAELAITRKTGRDSNRPTVARRQQYESVGVIYKMMNNIVVALMESCNDVLNIRQRGFSAATLLHASERAVISYCHLFHLLICLCRTTPQILLDATARLRRFVGNPASRTKTQVPDLGELIVLVTLVLALPPINGEPVTWQHLNGPFLEEAVIRNVRWVLKESPELEVMEQGPSDYRLAKTFERSRTSLRLIMFQVTFLNIFVSSYASDISRLDDNYGFAQKEIPERMVEEIKDIYKINIWPAFFDRVQYAGGRAFGKPKFSDILRKAVRTSGERGYHIPSPSRRQPQLLRERGIVERQWQLKQ